MLLLMSPDLLSLNRGSLWRLAPPTSCPVMSLPERSDVLLRRVSKQETCRSVWD